MSSGRSHNKYSPRPVAAWREVVEHLCRIVEGKAPGLWWVLFSLCLLLVGGLIYSLIYITTAGVGVLGTDHTVFWGWDIINFVFWIGIGHAGTLISAILLLTRQKWRTSVSRIAEVTTIMAVLCAAIFPIFHMGRVWMAWFFVPVPEANGMWQNFLSPLMWDAFAVGTYFFLSCAFLYISLIPDLAILRDRAGKSLRARFYGILALGWRGNSEQWGAFRRASLLLAGILTPLVISVHSIVALDFAVTMVPGWSSGLFPPYFVVGAILGGLAMVLIVVIPMRRVFKLEKMISINHLDSLGKLLLAMSLAIGFAYGLEFFMTMFSGHLTDIAVYKRRMFGEYAYVFWLMAGCNVMIPQLLWFRKLRRSLPCLLLIGVTVTIGMWLERFVIIVNTMEQGVIPATWANYMPSMTDVLMFAGTFGLFFGGILLFIRFFPCVSIVELCEQRSHQELGALKAHEGAMEGRYEKWSEFIEAFRNNPLEMEAISPFAVQEVERSSAAPDAFSKGAFRGGVTGLLLSSILAGWTQLVDYPLILQGKEVDLSRFIGFFPVLFETTLLGAGIGVILQFCRASGLLRWWHPWFESREYAEFSSRPAFYLWRKERT